MNPNMLQYLQQLYGQRAMPGGIANMPAQNVPLGGQTNWMNPPQLADDSGMYGPTLSTLFSQAGATGAPNMVNAQQGYGLGFNGPRPGGYMLGNQGPMPGGQTNWMPGNQGRQPMPRSPMPTRPAMTGQVNNGLAMQQRQQNGQQMRANMMANRQMRKNGGM